MSELNPHRRIALVHDWLTGMRGGEKVLEVFCEIFPQADIYTLIHVPGQVSDLIERHRIFTSPLQRFPAVGRYYRNLLPLMPWAIEQFHFEGYDLVISTSHCVAKGAIIVGKTRHWCYCHTPMRYVWDQFDDYFGPGRTSGVARLMMRMLRPRLQRWDISTLPRVHEFIANSENVRERIRRLYHREARVIYPPVDYNFYSQLPADPREAPLEEGNDPFFLIVSALAPYKRIDIALEAFRTLGLKLVVIGEGQDSPRLRSQAGPHVRFLGWRDNAELRTYYRRCRALIFPGEEDFGIVPLEAMAAGAPVIAFRKGGALETVIDQKTGLFFNDQTAESLLMALRRFESMPFNRDEIRKHAQTFSRGRCDALLRQTFIEYTSEMS